MSKTETWLINGTIYTQNNNREVRQAHIQIVNGIIQKITEKKPEDFSPGSIFIDATDLVLIPGFVQAHIHLCQTLFRNQADELELLDWLSKKIWVMEAAHTEATLYASALLGIHELISSGTTCILDMGTVRHTQTILKAIQETGLRASVGKCLMDHPKQAPATLREETHAALTEAEALFEEWHGKENDRIRISFAPRFALSCTDTLLKSVAKLAHKKGTIIHTHASENQKEIELVRELTGMENVEYLHKMGLTSSQLVLAHCVWLNHAEKEILQRTGTHIVHCPSSNLKLASGIAPIPDLQARNINIALGADGAPCNNNLNMFNELRLAALIHKYGSGPQAVRAMEALDMATRNGAQALGWFNEIGSIEEGKKADIVAMNLNTPTNAIPEAHRLRPEAIASSIVYSSQASHILWSMVDGNILYKHGKVTTLPISALMEKVRTAQAYFTNHLMA